MVQNKRGTLRSMIFWGDDSGCGRLWLLRVACDMFILGKENKLIE